MQRSPDFYQYYPKLFYAYYPNISLEKIKQLSLIGHQYYNSIILLDRIVDDNKTSDIFEMITLQEESIKLLSSIYGLESRFWNLWVQRKREYFQAVRIENSLYELNRIDFELYQDLADKKSAFGKVAIDSLFTLERKKDNETYKKLLLSHKYFSVGFQLYDDVKDFKEDFEKGLDLLIFLEQNMAESVEGFICLHLFIMLMLPIYDD